MDLTIEDKICLAGGEYRNAIIETDTDSLTYINTAFATLSPVVHFNILPRKTLIIQHYLILFNFFGLLLPISNGAIF